MPHVHACPFCSLQVLQLPGVNWVGVGLGNNYLLAAQTGVDVNRNVSQIVTRVPDGPDDAANDKLCLIQYDTFPDGSRINSTRREAVCP